MNKSINKLLTKYHKQFGIPANAYAVAQTKMVARQLERGAMFRWVDDGQVKMLERIRKC